MSVYPRRAATASPPPALATPRHWLAAAVTLLLLRTAPALAQDPPPLPAPAPPDAAMPAPGLPPRSPPTAPAAPAPAPAPDPAVPAPAPYPFAPAPAPAPAATPAPPAGPYPYPTPYPAAPAAGPGYPQPQPYGAQPGAPGPPGARLTEPPPPEPAWPNLDEEEYRRHRLTLQTESVFSADEGPFYNHLLGGRYSYSTTRATNLGVYAGYANLKGTGERVHSVLFLGQFEYQLFFDDFAHVIVPLRVGLGYLVENGPMVRFATGVYFAVSEDLQAGMDLIAPSYWSASNDTVLSMSLSAEVSYVF